MTNLGSVLKSRDIVLPTKVSRVKAMIFPVVMYGCENWTIKRAEHWRIDSFELWCWRRPWKGLESPLESKEIKPVNPKGNQPWSFFGRTDTETEAPILWPPDGRTNSLEKILMLGKIKGRKRRGQQSMRWSNGITDSKDMSLSKLQKIVKDRDAWHSAVHGVSKSQTRFSDRTTTKMSHLLRQCWICACYSHPPAFISANSNLDW